MSPRTSPFRIVAIDDDPVSIAAYSIMIDDSYEFFGETDAVVGLELINRVLPDLILLDYQMPVLNGYQVLERLRDSDATADIPVILVTAFEQDLTSKIISSEGVVGVVPKPLDANYLAMAIADGLSLDQMMKLRRQLLRCS